MRIYARTTTTHSFTSFFSFFSLLHIYTFTSHSFTFMKPTTPKLNFKQIQFLNNFIYGKPHSFRNPNTLFQALHLQPHITASFNKLHLSLPLLQLYTRLLNAQQLHTYTNTLFKPTTFTLIA